MAENIPLSKLNFLSKLYGTELAYINTIIRFQEHHYYENGEMVILIDSDFPNFKKLTEKKLGEITYLYEYSGWKIRVEALNERKECLLVFS